MPGPALISTLSLDQSGDEADQAATAAGTVSLECAFETSNAASLLDGTALAARSTGQLPPEPDFPPVRKHPAPTWIGSPDASPITKNEEPVPAGFELMDPDCPLGR